MRRKAILLAIMSIFCLFTLFCGGNEEVSASGETQGRILIAYFSWAENNDGNFGVDAVSTSSLVRPGNVEELAHFVEAMVGGDLFSIRVEDPYPASWDECLSRANNERRRSDRPALQERVENIDGYDIVFVGYPNWWYGIPMALHTFFEENDLSGKQVYLFCSHGTGGLARSVSEIEAAIPESFISSNVFHINEHRASSGRDDVRDWLLLLGFDV